MAIIKVNGVLTTSSATAEDVYPITNLGDLGNVQITSPQPDDLLTYNGSVWVNQPFTGGSLELTDLYLTGTLTTDNETILGTWDDLNRVEITDSTVKILADYSHPLHFYGEPGVENGNVKMWVFGGFGGALDAVALTTEGNNEMLRLVAYDTGGGDDGSHETVLLLRGDSGNYLYSRDTGGGLGSNVPLQVRAQEFDVRTDDAIILRVNGNTVIEVTDAEVIVDQPINSTANISSTATVSGDTVSATNNVTAGGDVTADGDFTGNSIAVGTGAYFNDAGTVNGNYLNMQSPANYNSTAQFIHTLNTDDSFHQFIRFGTDMTDQTPYSHSFTFFGQTTSDAAGTQNIGAVSYSYDQNGLHEIALTAEAQYNDVDLEGKDVVAGSHLSVKIGSPLRLQSVAVLATAPASPVNGASYIDTTDGNLKIYADGWQSFSVENGTMVYDFTNNRTLIYENSAWRVITTTAI